MGYSYDQQRRLACDRCGSGGHTRKRKCPYTVTSSAAHGGDTLPYCSPPALCPDCYRQEGGLRGVHGERCREGAANLQREEDAIQARLDKGDALVVARIGGPHSGYPHVQAGQVLVIFRDLARTETSLVVPDGQHEAMWLSDYPTPV